MENVHVWTGSSTGALKEQFVLSYQSRGFQVHSPEMGGCTERCTCVHQLLGIFLQLQSSVLKFREVAGKPFILPCLLVRHAKLHVARSKSNSKSTSVFTLHSLLPSQKQKGSYPDV